MEAVLLALVVVLVFSLAAARMVRRWDPPYQGVHERRGRHRARDWEGGHDALG
jgi:hypothetical protein